MRFRLLLALAMLGFCSIAGSARAQVTVNAPLILAVAVGAASNVTFSVIDLSYAAQEKRLPLGGAITELALSAPQLVIAPLLAIDAEKIRSYLIVDTVLAAVLTAHGIVSIATAPSQRSDKKSARTWDLVATPSSVGRGATLNLMGLW